MKGGNQQGYTIVEVLLFVAISGFMFVVSAVFINGKQAQVEFKQGINAANATVQGVVNEVANGQYDQLGNYHCTANSGGGAPQFLAGSASPGSTFSEGTSGGCIFLGKVLQLNVGSVDTAYDVYTVAARQLDSTSGSPVNTFAAAVPVPVAGGSAPDLTTGGHLQDGLSIKKMLYCASGDVDCNGPGSYSIGAVGVFGSFSSYSASSALTQDSGAQSITVVALPWVPFGDSKTNAVSLMTTKLSTLDPSLGTNYIIGGGSYVLLCLENGSKKGSVTLGGDNGQQFNTAIHIGGEPAICTS